MKRYIEIERMRQIIREQEQKHGLKGLAWVEMAMNNEPLVDVQEVKHGKWILVQNGTGVCSECHRQDHIDPLAKYCRYCGTRLEERGND